MFPLRKYEMVIEKALSAAGDCGAGGPARPLRVVIEPVKHPEQSTHGGRRRVDVWGVHLEGQPAREENGLL